MEQSQSRKTQSGYAAVVISSIMFGSTYALGDIVSNSGMSKTCNDLWVALLVLIGGSCYCLLRHKAPLQRISRRQFRLCVLCGIGTWASNVLFLVAYQYISVSEATMLHFLHPSLIAVFMTLAFGERFTGYKVAAILCSIAALFLMTGHGLSSGSLLGIGAALMTGICYSVYPISMEVSSLREVEGETIILYMNMTRACCATLVSLLLGNFMTPINKAVFLVNIAQATASFGAYLLSGYAVRVIGATNTSFAAMLEPIMSCVIAILFLGESMSANIFFAGIMVLLSVLFCSLNNKPATQSGED